MNNKFDFLKSVRFWNLVIIATVFVLRKEGILVEDSFITTISEIIAIALGGSTVVKTVDRIGDKKVEAAEVTASTITYEAIK